MCTHDPGILAELLEVELFAVLSALWDMLHAVYKLYKVLSD